MHLSLCTDTTPSLREKKRAPSFAETPLDPKEADDYANGVPFAFLVTTYQ